MVRVMEECPRADWTTAGCTLADRSAVASGNTGKMMYGAEEDGSVTAAGPFRLLRDSCSGAGAEAGVRG